MTMPEVETETEGVGSEDEGPEDFTLNLEKWMRGNEKWQRDRGADLEETDEQKADGIVGQQEDEREWTGHTEDEREYENDAEDNPEEDDGEGQHEEMQESENMRIHKDHADESDFEPLSSSTPAPLKSQKYPTQVDVGSADNGNLQPPPLSRFNTETLQNRAAEEVFDQISELQAEVERLRLGDQNDRYINEMLKRAHVSDQEENGRLKIELQNLKEVVVGLQEEKGAIEKAMARDRKVCEDAGSKVGSLRAKFEPMVQELAVVRSTADAEKKVANSKIATLEAELLTSKMEIIKEQQDCKVVQDAKQDEINNLRSALKDLKREASDRRQAIEAQLLASQREIAEVRKDFEALNTTNEDKISRLKAKLESCQIDVLSHQRALKGREQDHTVEVTKLIAQLEAAKDLESDLAVQKMDVKDLESNLAVQKMDLDHVHDQLRDTRRIVQTVKQENERLTKETERQSKEIDEITGQLTRKETELQAAESSIDKLQDQLAGRGGEKHSGTTDTEAQAHESALKDLQQQHQTGIQEMKTAHEKELKSLKLTIVRAGDGMRKRKHQAKKSHREELASLRQKIASLEKSVAASKTPIPDPPPSADIAELRNGVRILLSQLTTNTAALQATRLALTESQDALVESRIQTAEIRASKAEVIQQLEEKFEVAVETREKEWRRRIGIMFRDREKMGKALLCAWGREEVGDKGKDAEGGKQGYRYQFVQR